MDNFEAIASPSLARPLQICDAISILALHWEPCGLLSPYPRTFGKSWICPPIVRISSAWRSGNFRASACFAIRIFRKWVEWIVLSSWFGWTRFCWKMRGRRNCWRWLQPVTEGLTRDSQVWQTSLQLTWPCRSGNFVNLCQFLVAESFGQHAWDLKENVVVGFAFDLLSFLTRHDGWPGCLSYE